MHAVSIISKDTHTYIDSSTNSSWTRLNLLADIYRALLVTSCLLVELFPTNILSNGDTLKNNNSEQNIQSTTNKSQQTSCPLKCIFNNNKWSTYHHSFTFSRNRKTNSFHITLMHSFTTSSWENLCCQNYFPTTLSTSQRLLPFLFILQCQGVCVISQPTSAMISSQLYSPFLVLDSIFFGSLTYHHQIMVNNQMKFCIKNQGPPFQKKERNMLDKL